MAYSTTDVAHAWAHNLDKKHNGSSIFHNDGCLRSYSTCIAQRLEVNGKVIYIVNTARYSNSTNKHQSAAEQAIPVDAIVFRCNFPNWNNWDIIPQYSSTTGPNKTQRIRFGMRYLQNMITAVRDLATCTVLEHGVSYADYAKMEAWFDVTGDMAVKKLLRMNLNDFACYFNSSIAYFAYSQSTKWNVEVSKAKKFLKMASEGATIEELCDMMNGKGTWQAYQDRIAGLISAQRNRKLSEFVGYDKPNTRWCKRIDGEYETVRSGSINKKVRSQYPDRKDFIKFLLEEKRKNREEAIASDYKRKHWRARMAAKNRLEFECGCRWEGNTRFSTRSYCAGHYITLHVKDYNGTLLTREEWRYASPQSISDEEYANYVNLSPEDQAIWRRNKREEMREYILGARAEHEREMAEIHERQMRAARDGQYAKQVYEEEGDAGLVRIWHEGYVFPINGKPASFFNGGNVLLRVTNDMVETSKGIKVKREECARLWRIINRWHENGTEFYTTQETVKSTLSSFNISRFQHDIMIAGCHAIAYSEMAYVAQQLGFIG